MVTVKQNFQPWSLFQILQKLSLFYKTFRHTNCVAKLSDMVIVYQNSCLFKISDIVLCSQIFRCFPCACNKLSYMVTGFVIHCHCLQILLNSNHDDNVWRFSYAMTMSEVFVTQWPCLNVLISRVYAWKFCYTNLKPEGFVDSAMSEGFVTEWT